MELQKRRKNLFKIPVFVFFGVLVLGMAILFGLFHIRQVDVIGNEFYSAEEIKKMIMSDSLAENSIYLTWKYSHGSAGENLSFLNGAEVSMINPYHVRIRVFEKTIAGYLMYSGSRVYFDTDGKVVEISAQERDNVVPFSGISIAQPEIGENLPVSDDDFFKSLTDASVYIQQGTFKPDEAHYDDKQNLILYYGSSRVLMGNSSYMEEKFLKLEEIMSQMEGMSGTLHMENYAPGTTTFSFMKGERGEEEQELLINVGKDFSEEGEEMESETSGENLEGEVSGGGYTEDPSRITTDADGNQIYTDSQGNVTTNLDKPYLGDDGQIISDGYGYIDPYTGAYILNN